MSSWFFSYSKSSQAVPVKQPTSRSPASSLVYYEAGSMPPSARVDPKFKLQPRRPMRLWDYCKIGPIIAAKATQLTSDVLSHHIWGPRRKTWGIEMTIITSLARGADRHSSFVDIGTLRMLMGLGGLVPLPSDALVTPVTFRVKKRNLKGILAEFDAKEDGTRELSGEWVVGRKTWHRMQTEWKASSKTDLPSGSDNGAHSAPPKKKELVVLYIHGGAYYLSSAAVQRIITIPLAKYTDSRVFAIDYRLAPETCFPGPLHDVLTAYLRLVEELHIPPENIIVSGDSAGGGLALALLMYLRDHSYPLPAGGILMSPWVDLSMSCESWETNAPYDVIVCPQADNHMNPVALYLGEGTEEYLTHPYASPLFGDFKGLPPLLIQAGDCEVLRDEITLLAHKATAAGVQVIHELYEDAIHVFHAYPFIEASRQAFESMRHFVRSILPQSQARSPQMLGATTEQHLEREIESDRAVVVDGDGAEISSSQEEVENFGKETKMIKTDGSEESEDETSWVRTPIWPKMPLGSRSDRFSFDSQASESTDYGDVDDDTADWSSTPQAASPANSCLSFSPSSSFISSSSASSFSSLPRRIQSTSSLMAQFALHFKHAKESSQCPTPPLTARPNSSQVNNFDFDFIDGSSTSSLTKKERAHKRSQSSNCSAPLSLSGSAILQQSHQTSASSTRKHRQSLSTSSRKRSNTSTSSLEGSSVRV